MTDELERPTVPMMKINWDEVDKKDLSEPQKEALRFIAAGFGNIEASKSIGMHRSVISKWLSKSIDFLNAYERVIAEVRKYNTAMLEYVTTNAWLRIYQYLTFDPAELIKDKTIPPTIVKTLITEQGRMLRHVAGGIRPQTYIVEHDVTPALLKATENAAAVIADRMAELDEPMAMETHVAEYRAALASPKPHITEGQITVDWKEHKLQCPICAGWFPNLRHHCKGEHGLTFAEVREQYNLAPDAPVDFATALRKPLND